MKKTVVFLTLLIIIVVATACAAKAPVSIPDTGTVGVPDTGTVGVPAPAPASPPIFAPRPTTNPEPITQTPGGVVVGSDSGQTLLDERMIVRTADMSLVVNDVPIALDRIAQLAEDSGGYVVSSTEWKQDQRLIGAISIRVPTEGFNSIMATLRELAVEVTREDTSSQDVTEEYVDLSSKLKNLEATETQLLQIMAKAEKVEDVLNVQRELSKTRGKIEQVKGRMQFLERTSATSLIRVQLSQSELSVNFSADNRRVKAGEVIHFTGQISGGFSPYSYEWDFGDGQTSTLPSPTHAYKTVGDYTVALKVSDDRANTFTRTRELYIDVIPGWSPGNTARSAWNGLVTFGQVFADIVIWLAIASPVWLVIGGGLFWFLRRKRAKRA